MLPLTPLSNSASAVVARLVDATCSGTDSINVSAPSYMLNASETPTDALLVQMGIAAICENKGRSGDLFVQHAQCLRRLLR